MHFPREDSEIITGDISSAAKTSRPFGTLWPFSSPLLPPLLALKVLVAIVKRNCATCKRGARDLRLAQPKREIKRKRENTALPSKYIFAPNSRDNIFFRRGVEDKATGRKEGVFLASRATVS